MSTSLKRNASVAAATAVLVVLASAFWLCRGTDPDPAPLEETDLAAPTEVPSSWQELDTAQNLVVDLEAGPIWQTDTGDEIFRGPVVEGLDLSWERKTHDQWTVAIGRGQTEGVDLEFRIWTAPGFPTAIVDVDARLSGRALGEKLAATTSVPATKAEFLTGSLDSRSLDDSLEDFDILAGRFQTPGPTVQLQSPDGATGSAESNGDNLAVDWTLWPALDDVTDCLDDPDSTRTISSRLVVTFGDQPAVGSLPVPVDAHSYSTPIFVDAPARTDDPWVDGRARDSRDLARRYLALAFGHSDANDPRYGNGGLLAADMGAIFVVPADWWETPPVLNLRDSLRNTDIDVVPSTTDGETSRSTRIATPDDCDTIVSGLADREKTTIIRDSTGESTYQAPLTTPLSPIIETGRLSTNRTRILDRLFDTDDSTPAAGSAHHVKFAPLVATRNPLEDISSENLLSPDSDGHWTLHDQLTRRFSRMELERDVDGHHTTGLDELRDHRNNHRTALPYWAPDGILEHQHDSAEHLYFFGDFDDVDLDEESDSGVATWRYDETSLPVYDGELTPTVVEFE